MAQVVAQNTEWAGREDSEDEQDPAELAQHEAAVFEKRERRLTDGLEALSQEKVLGDREVDVVAQNKEWDAVQEPEDDDSLDQYASEAYKKREKRLTSGEEILVQEKIIPDIEVEVFEQSAEWAATGDDSGAEDNPEDHESETYQARERRLTAGAEVLGQGTTRGDEEVEVVAENGEWSADVQNEDVNGPDGLAQNATEAFQSRERRLTAGAEVLGQVPIIGDVDVEVVVQSSEWDGDAAVDEAGPDKHEAELFQRREKRLSTATEALQQMSIVGDADVEVKTESTEWAAGADGDGDQSPSKHETDVFERREKRLSTAADALQSLSVLGDEDVEVKAESTEWSADANVEPDDGADEYQTAVFERREKRLSTATEALQQLPVLGDEDVVVKESGEWACTEADDANSPSTLDDHESEVFRRREKRLTSGAEALKSMGLEALPQHDFDPPSRDAPLEASVETSEVAATATTSAPSGAASVPETSAASSAGEAVVGNSTAAPVAAADAGAAEDSGESEYETDSETDDEIFNRANPERGLKRGEEACDPWKPVFHWIVHVIEHRLKTGTQEVINKRIRGLLPGAPLVVADLTPEDLCDGKILCAFMNALRPEAMAKPIANAMGRLAQVQQACKKLGVRDMDCFTPSDIMSAPPQNPGAVLRCLAALAALADGWSDWTGPKMKRPGKKKNAT